MSPFLENQTAGARKLCELQHTEFPSTFRELAGRCAARAAPSGGSPRNGCPGAPPRQPPPALPRRDEPPQPALPHQVAFLAPAEAAQARAAAAAEQAQPKLRLLESSVNSPLDFCMEIQRVSAGQRCRQRLILCSRSLAGIQLSREPAKKRVTGSRRAGGNTTGGVIPLSFFPLPVLIDGAGSRAELIVSPSPLHPPP